MRQNNLIDKLNQNQIRDDIPDFRPGDTINVAVRVVEGKTERIQNFQGVVIKRHGAGIQATYTVRRIASGVGVERIFPVNSPRVASVTVIRRGAVRRAKLYYLRDRTGKGARIKASHKRPIPKQTKPQKKNDVDEAKKDDAKKPADNADKK